MSSTEACVGLKVPTIIQTQPNPVIVVLIIHDLRLIGTSKRFSTERGANIVPPAWIGSHPIFGHLIDSLAKELGKRLDIFLA
jgi:hypothetical protein